MAMKMTLHIDEHILAEVMEAHGFDTKTEAIDFALRELDRRKKLRAFVKEGMGMSSDELKDAIYDDYSPDVMMVAEEPLKYPTPKKKK